MTARCDSVSSLCRGITESEPGDLMLLLREISECDVEKRHIAVL